MRELFAFEESMVSGGVQPQDIGELGSGEIKNQIIAASNGQVVEVDFNNDGITDNTGVVIDGVLHVDGGGTYDRYIWKSDLTAGDVFNFNSDNMPGTAYADVFTSFVDGQVFTGIGQIISGAPEILGNLMDQLVENAWDYMAAEVTRAYSEYYDVYVPATPPSGEDEEEDTKIN